MSERRLDPHELLPEKPFEHGMATAFDLFGVSGRKMNAKILKQWRSIVDQPRKSAEEALLEDIDQVSSQYRRLLEEQKQ